MEVSKPIRCFPGVRVLRRPAHPLGSGGGLRPSALLGDRGPNAGGRALPGCGSRSIFFFSFWAVGAGLGRKSGLKQAKKVKEVSY